MTQRISSLVMLCVAISTFNSPAAETLSTRDESTSHNFNGTWSCLWDQRNGHVDESEVGTQFVFDGTQMVQTKNGRTLNWGYRFPLEDGGNAVDWVETNGDVTKGIFWIDGDTLVFCDGTLTGERPKSFLMPRISMFFVESETTWSRQTNQNSNPPR